MMYSIQIMLNTKVLNQVYNYGWKPNYKFTASQPWYSNSGTEQVLWGVSVCALLMIHSDQHWKYTQNQKRNCTLPRIEKKIMKPVDIWTTLWLQTCVKASKPAFSLQISKQMII